MQDPSLVGDLYHSLWQHQILNPLIEARDGTHVLMDATTTGNLTFFFFFKLSLFSDSKQQVCYIGVDIRSQELVRVGR